MHKVIAVLAVVFSCTQIATASEPWSVFIYIAADNDLESMSFADIAELESLGQHDDRQIYVQYDRLSEPGIKRVRIEPSTPGRSQYMKPPFAGSVLIEELPELDSASPKVFRSFLDWAFTQSVGRRLAIVIWSHGDGWTLAPPDRATSVDASSGTSILLADLASTMVDSTRAHGRLIDLIAFDACLMGMVEVAYSIRNAAHYFVASEDIVPGYGFAYDQWLAQIVNESPKEAAMTLVKTFGESYSGGSQGRRRVQLAAVDLSWIDLLAWDVKRWVEVVTSDTTNRALMKPAAQSSTEYNFFDDHRDLGSLMSEVMSRSAESSNIFNLSKVVSDRLREAVIAQVNTHVESQSTGLAVYLPIDSSENSPWGKSTYRDRRLEYQNTAFSKRSDWAAFLDWLFVLE